MVKNESSINLKVLIYIFVFSSIIFKIYNIENEENKEIRASHDTPVNRLWKYIIFYCLNTIRLIYELFYVIL